MKQAIGTRFVKQVKRLLTILLTLSPLTANAGLITNIDLIDNNNFSLSISGTLDGPRPPGDSWLFIGLNPAADPLTCGNTSTCGASYVSGDLFKNGTSTPNGFWMADYVGGPHIQINWSPLNVGDLFSGTSIFSVATGHGMTLNDFVGAGVYWGYSGNDFHNGIYQGGVNASRISAVPAPATIWLFTLAIAIFAGLQRSKKKA